MQDGGAIGDGDVVAKHESVSYSTALNAIQDSTVGGMMTGIDSRRPVGSPSARPVAGPPSCLSKWKLWSSVLRTKRGRWSRSPPTLAPWVLLGPCK